jgi:hypothetical protein
MRIVVLGETDMKFTQIYDNEWYEAAWTGQRDMCCSCGLIHITDFKVENGKLMFRARQSQRATKEARKKFKFERN